MKDKTNELKDKELETVTGGQSDDYSDLFSGVTPLEKPAPELPATTLQESAYENMFSGATGLTQSPTLPGTHDSGTFNIK